MMNLIELIHKVNLKWVLKTILGDQATWIVDGNEKFWKDNTLVTILKICLVRWLQIIQLAKASIMMIALKAI